MINIRVLVDGQQVSATEAKSPFVLPDVVAHLTQSYDHDPQLELDKEEKVRGPDGQLTEVIVRYRSKAGQIRPAA